MEENIKESLILLHKELCVDPKTEDKYCDKCILAKIPYGTGGFSKDDLCFAIWHDKILGDIESINHPYDNLI